jgi:hypothetical protein
MACARPSEMAAILHTSGYYVYHSFRLANVVTVFRKDEYETCTNVLDIWDLPKN